MTETVKDLMPFTPDLNAERLAKLKELFPDLFTDEGDLNEDELKKLVDPKSVNETERYEFRWFGKSNAKRKAFTPTTATLNYDAARSVNPETSENLIIEGENLKVLKLLLCSYREQIKCIYIDPPYNTGKDFVYSDNYSEDRLPYWKQTNVVDEYGVKIDTNADTDGRYHSNWMNMMFSRLLVARQLLRKDGVIFISIDDNEVHNLRRLCNEVFGEDNFVANIVWQKKYAISNDDEGIGVMHDYILCYRKDTVFERNLLPRTEKQLERYKNIDNDERGDWSSDNYVSNKSKSERPTLYYPIIHPKTGEEIYPDENAVWRYSREKHQQIVDENRLYWGKKLTYRIPRIKRFLNEIQDGLVPNTWWKFEDVGHNDEAQKETFEIIGRKIFSTPKPVRLIKRILEIGCGENDLILDFFAGSGVTGQAVMESNEADGGNRKFILVQLPERTDEKSEAYKAGYKLISDITIERNKRVVERLFANREARHPNLFDNTEQVAAVSNESSNVEAESNNIETKLNSASTKSSLALSELSSASTESSSASAKLSLASTELSSASTELSLASTELSLVEAKLDSASTKASFGKAELSSASNKSSIGRASDKTNLGFKVFKLEKSYFPRTEWTPNPEADEAENVQSLKDYITEKESQLRIDFDRDKLLTEILLKEGFKLNYAAAPFAEVKTNEILHVSDTDKEALVCLDNTIKTETADYFKTHKDLKFICLERGLDTTKKWNLANSLGEKFKAI